MALPIIGQGNQNINLNLDPLQVQKVIQSQTGLFSNFDKSFFNLQTNTFTNLKNLFEPSFESMKEALFRSNNFLEKIANEIHDVFNVLQKPPMPPIEDNDSEFDKKKREEEERKWHEETEKSTGFLAKIASLIENAGRSVKNNTLPFLMDPSHLAHSFWGAFFGSGILGAFTKILTSPLYGAGKFLSMTTAWATGLISTITKTIGSLLIRTFGIAAATPGLIGGGALLAVTAIANGLWDAIANYSETAMETNNGGFAGFIGRFMAGSGKDDFMSRMTQYSKWAGIGAGIGIVGGPVGMIAGALIGGAIGYAFEYIGSNFFSDWTSIIGEKFKNVFQIFTGVSEEEKKSIDEIIRTQKEYIDSQKSMIAENNVKIEELLTQYRDAKTAGNEILMMDIQSKIDVLRSSNTDISADIEREKKKLEEHLFRKEQALKEGFWGRLANWIADVDIPVPNVEFSYKEGIDVSASSWINVGEFTENLKKKVVGVFHNMMNSAIEKWDSAVGTVSNFGDKIKNMISDWVNDFIQTMKDSLKNANKWFEDTFTWENIKNELYKKFGFGEEETSDGEEKSSMFGRLFGKEVEEPVSETLNTKPIPERSAEIVTETKKKNESETVDISKILLELANVNNNFINNNVSNSSANVLQLRRPTQDGTYSGYMRGVN